MARKDTYEYAKGKKYPVEGNVFKTPQKPKRDAPKNVHEGHRDRLRSRFLNEGLEGFQDHNALELLLFYGIPMKDTNEEAHALMNTFGSISGVFDAPYEELCEVKGIGEKTAALIKLMPALFQKYEVDKLNNDGAVLNTSELCAKYVSKFFKGVSEEQLYLLCLDSNCEVLCFEKISEGTLNAAPVNVNKIVEIAVKVHAVNIILAHNHPSGVVAPSKSDSNTTVAMADILERVGLRFSDHIIIGHGNDYFSYRHSEKWKYLFK